MKTNAYTDVYLPATKLMKLPLPGEDRNGGLIFPGPTVLQALGLSSRSNTYSIKIGNLFFYPVVFQKVEPTFSLETDINGYHIWIILKIDIKTIYTATTNAISNLDNSSIKDYN